MTLSEIFVSCSTYVTRAPPLVGPRADLRRLWQLDVQIGTLHLTDRIEWDLSSSLTPELFASVLVRDLSLSSNAAPLIAHALHEELMRIKKSCLEMGLLGADDQTLKRRGVRPLEGAWREWNETLGFGPRVEVLSLDEMDRVEAERERANRCVWVWALLKCG